MRQYKIISDFSLAQIELSVNMQIKEGWEPLGGVVVVYGKVSDDERVKDQEAEDYRYLQAMIK